MSYDPNGYYAHQPQQLPPQMVLPTMSLLVHARSKIGKSTLACTAPPPMVVFDAEGSTKFLPMRVVGWDPKMGGPPAWDGVWEACMVIVSDFDTLVRGLSWLESGQHHFRSVIVDSVSEIQRKLKDKITGGGRFQRDDWGELLRLMDINLRGMRDLTLNPINPMQMAVFVSETRLYDEMYMPSMEGGVRDAMPYWFDVVGYYRAVQLRGADNLPAVDPYNGEPVMVRQLLTRAVEPIYYAGERVQGRVPTYLNGAPTSMPPSTMWEATPHLTRDVLWRVFPHLAPQATQ